MGSLWISHFPYIYHHFLDSRKFKISNSEASIDKDRGKKKKKIQSHYKTDFDGQSIMAAITISSVQEYLFVWLFFTVDVFKLWLGKCKHQKD